MTSLDQIDLSLDGSGSVLDIKVVKGLKTGTAYKIDLGPYHIDCAHYEIPLSSYLLRRSRGEKKVLIFESTVTQEPMTLGFKLVD